MKLLKIYFGETEVYKSKPLFEYVVELCYKNGIAGVTVLKGFMSYGIKRHVHRSDFFSLSGDLPIVIEIVDEIGKIDFVKSKIEQLSFNGIIIESNIKFTRINKK